MVHLPASLAAVGKGNSSALEQPRGRTLKAQVNEVRNFKEEDGGLCWTLLEHGQKGRTFRQSGGLHIAQVHRKSHRLIALGYKQESFLVRFHSF